jgi:hypothetical protein
LHAILQCHRRQAEKRDNKHRRTADHHGTVQAAVQQAGQKQCCHHGTTAKCTECNRDLGVTQPQI